MKNTIKMMAAVAVFAMTALIAPDSMGAVKPASEKPKKTEGPCAAIAGNYTYYTHFESVVESDEFISILECDITLTVTINADCTTSSSASATCELY